jgi:peptidoglycan/xylan/chitin deacetylase (PgdA/CDA1 family)
MNSIPSIKVWGKAIARSAAAEVIRLSSAEMMFRKAGDPDWAILMYHRVIDPNKVPYYLQPGMYVRPETFDRQLSLLKKQANILAIDDLVDMISKGEKPPEKSLAITFDDGWLDTYKNAFPILKKHQVPATVFLPTSYIGSADWFWSDRFAKAIACLRNSGERCNNAAARLFENEDIGITIAQRFSELLTVPPQDLPQELENSIDFLKSLEINKRKQAVRFLVRLAQEFSTFTLDRAFINWDEAKEMSEAGITFGSHTHTHQPVPELSEAQIADEIKNSMQLMRKHDLNTTKVFCYPGGYYNQSTQGVLAQEGVTHCLSVSREHKLSDTPAILGRVGIHEDISSSDALLNARIWSSRYF